MTTKTLYVYQRSNGETVVTPNKPYNHDYTTKLRLVADEGRAITNGSVVVSSLDTDSADGWMDCDLPEPRVDYNALIDSLNMRVIQQEETIAMLTDGILEMSELVYND